jgi:integrase
MPAIRKRSWETPKGEIKTAWLVDYRDSLGARRSKQFPRKKDAERWLVDAAWQVSRGTHTADSQSVTVEKAAGLWLDRAARDELEESTIASYEQHVRLHILPLCGKTKLSQITRPNAETLRDQLLDRLSRAMAARVLQSLTGIAAEAQRRGLIAQNVFAGVTVRNTKRERPKLTIPTKPELQRMILTAADCSNPMAQPLILIVTFAGLRASELRGLPWRNVDLSAKTLKIDQRANRKNEIGPPKSAAGYRTIPLPDLAIAALRTWKLKCPPTEEELVFPSLAGKPMSHAYMTKNVLTPVELAAGCHASQPDAISEPEGNEPLKKPKYTLHAFRHAAASLWIEQKVNPKRIQYWMGHSSIQVTYDTYGHLFDQADQDSTLANAIQNEVLGIAHAS